MSGRPGGDSSDCHRRQENGDKARVCQRRPRGPRHSPDTAGNRGERPAGQQAVTAASAWGLRIFRTNAPDTFLTLGQRSQGVQVKEKPEFWLIRGF